MLNLQVSLVLYWDSYPAKVDGPRLHDPYVGHRSRSWLTTMAVVGSTYSEMRAEEHHDSIGYPSYVKNDNAHFGQH